jgi:hypothetical protein
VVNLNGNGLTALAVAGTAEGLLSGAKRSRQIADRNL